MKSHILNLQRRSQQLEPNAEQLASLFDGLQNFATTFLNNLGSSPTYRATDSKGIGLLGSPIAEDGISLQACLKLLDENLVKQGLNPASGGHLGYIPGGGIVYSAFGDFLADITNQYSGIFFAGPGAVRMENMMLNWMADIVGYPSESAGNLSSGGSMANLIGIVTARDARQLKSGDFCRSPIYLSRQVHHSVDKAIRIAGLRECPIRYIPLDERYRLRADLLEEAVVQDKQDGLNPWLVIASAGTTDTGAVDPLPGIGQIAASHELWFHLDAAYGGFFVLCDEGKRILAGMDASDSIVMDPHKGLFLPYGSGAVLVKDGRKLFEAHYYMANYMQDTIDSRDELSPADLSPELTKHFRGLRFWLPLKLLGIKPFRAALEEKLLLARYFHARLQEMEGFEVGPAPELSVVTYRYLPKKGGANEFNKKLVQEIHKDGRVFVSSTVLDGKFTLRLAVLVFRTHLQTIDLVLEILQEKVDRLQRS